MRKLLVAVVAAVPLVAGAGMGAAQAESVNKSIVINQDGFLCFDGFGNQTTKAVKVATRSGSVKVTCQFDADDTNWPDGTRINVFTFGDCRVTDFNGNDIWLNSKFVVNKKGGASMTCN
ncbi:hypothetical protein [Nocardioides sp.]|uniref:hypothetical protein n=1 Tax=Nocardioides sp. TaxID=35761 RepID=UPI002ED462FD